MARGNTYICRTCGKTYNYCPACEFISNSILENGFCCKEHYDIFEILSKNGCNFATTEETLASLKSYDLNQEFAPSIKAHIDALKAEVATAKEAEAKPIEVNKSAPIEEKEVKSTTDFFKKK